MTWKPVILTAVAALLLSYIGCDGQPPPPPPPPPECELTEDSCEFGLDAEACECLPEPTPPPPPPPEEASCATPTDQRVDDDYIPLARTDHWQRELRAYDQRLIHNGIRNPTYALTHCGPDSNSNVWPYNGITVQVARDAIGLSTKAKNALTGADGESGFYERVAQQHPSRQEGRSRVYRPCFNEYFALARWLTDGCSEPPDGSLIECKRFHTSSRPDGVVAHLDGIKGACNELLE